MTGPRKAKSTRESPATVTFPADFLWGAATSAYQIEGSPLADGAGASNWHRFCHTPGMTEEGATGDVACDHYRRFAEDVGLMRWLGLKAYRFSISWSRILPEGRGAVNPAGLDFYSRLIDTLLENGIAPWVTLYHWDLPAALDDRGGWLNPDIKGWFSDYADTVYRALGDRVNHWMTLNEPWVVMDAGYQFGVHAPGHRSPFEAARAAHNLMRAHGAGVQAFRASGRPGQIGLAVNLEPKYAASRGSRDQAATRRADAYMNRWFLDGALRGGYPGELSEIFGEAWPEFAPADFKLMSQPIDFLGINYYTRGVVRDHPKGRPLSWQAVKPAKRLTSVTGWEVHPESLTRVLGWVRERYGDIPLYVTENGSAFPDPPSVRGKTHIDPRRVSYLNAHLKAAQSAIAAGVDLRGYFAWSLLDNFEWGSYNKRFGLFHVNFATQKRTPKASAHRYREVIRTNGVALSLSGKPA
ncbi:MAG: GH1 family beta-glucosidase [Candidatus Eisenbacteria bacterium]|nr:GH1 family beta-glucosidase [Candidatus Eisenbacteria bacterium]